MSHNKLFIDWRTLADEELVATSGAFEGPEPGDETALLRARRADHIKAMISSVGVPIVPNTKSPRESAIMLLRLAAEIEHALMVQYLYAGHSVPRPDGAQDPGTIDYHEKVVDIAVQEMGHLATVQNLLLLLGGPEAIHLQRDVLRRGSPKNPIPFVLEPVSLPSLAKYIAAERPAEIPSAWQTEVEALVEAAEQDAGVALNRVGVVYALLRWMFSSPEDGAGFDIDFTAAVAHLDKPRLTDDDLQPLQRIEPYLIIKADDSEWEATEDDFLLFHARSRVEAVVAIDKIAAQGEGLLNDPAASHFEEFMELVRDFNQGKIAVISLPKSPTLGKDGGEGGDTITHPYTRLWGEVFSLQYSIVILSIQHALLLEKAKEDEEPGLREKITASALRRMRRVLMPVGRVVASLPMNEGGTVLAGPPYDLDPKLLEQHDPTRLPAVHISILDRLAGFYQAIAKDAEFGNHPNHKITLVNLANLDAAHRKLFSSPQETQ